PKTGATGEDSFTYTIIDKDKGRATATVVVTIDADNIPPIALNDVATTTQNKAVELLVLLNDSDPDGNKTDLSIVSFTQGVKGMVTKTSDNRLSYSPDVNKKGVDDFTYTIEDKEGAQATAKVNITIEVENIAPIAVNDSVATNENTPIDISVLLNDSDPDGKNSNLSIISFSQAEKGVVTKTNSSKLTYTPNKNETEGSSFTYTIGDKGGATATAVVTVIVNRLVNQAPEITTMSTVNYAENGEGIILDIQSTDDNDTEGKGLSYEITGGADKELFGVDSKTGELTFNAVPNFEKPRDAGNDNTYDIDITVFDSEPLTDTQSLQVNVTNVTENSAPIITSENSVSYSENGDGVVLDIQSKDDNDTEKKGLSYEITGGADKELFGIDSNSGKLTFNTPPDFENPADVGRDNLYEIQVTVFDSEALTDVQDIKVTVADVKENSAPIANDDEYQIKESRVIGNVMDNDKDPDGDKIEVVPMIDAVSKIGVLNLKADGSFTYISDKFSGSDSFVYTLKDEQGATDTARLLIRSTIKRVK
ncbi:MAG: tandem-95 repeat protein, partial [Cocleimonas sp.]|nr:tandem-95 repeat protein [Cocleimonas sp.]